MTPTRSDVEYPILVESYTGTQAMTIVCESCAAEKVIGPDELKNDDMYLCPKDEYGKPTVCGGWALMKYAEADHKCVCGALGFFEEALGHCCSLRCKYEAEYLAQKAASS